MDEPSIDIRALITLHPDTLDAVHHAYADRLFRFLRRLGAGPEVAEELVQEAFVRLVRSAPRLTPDTRVGAWLYTVARNLYRSHRRWAWVDGTRLLEVATRSTREVQTPEAAVAGDQTAKRIEAAIAALPEAQREVFLLVVVEGLTPQEAAGVLGLPDDTTRQRLLRARRALQEVLQ